MTSMKGIILAGGLGTRLYPMTKSISKQLLPVYDKPMVYYPLAVLMMSGIRDILLITTPRDMIPFQELLGDGSQWGISISYAKQPKPEGLAQAFIIGRRFIHGESVCLVLGDNIFFGHGLPQILADASQLKKGAKIFGYWVSHPERYGVAEIDANGRVVSIEEKPKTPKSNHAVTGLYYYDNQVSDLAEGLQPSARGELEITDLNNCYLQNGELTLIELGRGMTWLDTGTPESLMQAASYIEVIEDRQGLKICCPEEVAWRNHWIDNEELNTLGSTMGQSGYGKYLLSLLTVDR